MNQTEDPPVRQVNQDLVNMSSLAYFQQLLQKSGRQAEYFPYEAGKRYENLLIFMGAREQGEDWARLYFSTDLLSDREDDFHVLELALPLGIQPPPERQAAIAACQGTINVLLPGPALLLQSEGLILRQSFVMLDQDDFFALVLLEALERMAFARDLVEPVCRAVVDGLDAEAALKRLEQTLSSPMEGLPTDAPPD